MATPIAIADTQVRFLESNLRKKPKKYSMGTMEPAEVKAILAGIVTKTEKGLRAPLKVNVISSAATKTALLEVQSPKPKDQSKD